jgi:hypothetical protein
VIISTNQECELHLLALACERLSIKYITIIDNWDNLSSKTIMTTHPSQLLVWSEQIINHAKNIQKYTGECFSIGSLRFEGLKKYADVNIKKLNKICFCGASVPSSEINFLEFLLENSEVEVIYRPHPIGFYVTNEIAKTKIIELEKLYKNKLQVVISTYGESPVDEISNLSYNLFSNSVIICCPTSTFI